eukprot:894632_1
MVLDVNCRDENQQTPLHHAAIKGDVKAINLLLGKNIDLEARDANGKTALHLAIANQQKDTLERLLNTSVKHTVDNEGQNALHLAAQLMNLEFIEMLRTITFYGLGKLDNNVKDNNGNTPLLLALKSG